MRKSTEPKNAIFGYNKTAVLLITARNTAVFSYGGDGRDRTVDLLTASQTLSQLSYAPITPPILNHLPLVVKKKIITLHSLELSDGFFVL